MNNLTSDLQKLLIETHMIKPQNMLNFYTVIFIYLKWKEKIWFIFQIPQILSSLNFKSWSWLKTWPDSNNTSEENRNLENPPDSHMFGKFPRLYFGNSPDIPNSFRNLRGGIFLRFWKFPKWLDIWGIPHMSGYLGNSPDSQVLGNSQKASHLRNVL